MMEEALGARPPYGVIFTGDGVRHGVENTAEPRAWVLALAGQIRAARAEVTRPIPADPQLRQFRLSGMRRHCGQGRLRA
jgi:CRISPR-associated exonuclease Cas4